MIEYMGRVLALVHTWLILDFFGDSRRSGQQGSTLTTTIFGQSFLGLVFAAVTVPDTADATYLVAYAAANLSLSTLLVGLSALGDERTGNRTAADDLLVRTAPLPSWTLALARTLHGGFSITLLTFGIALPPGLLIYWVGGHALWLVPAYLALACLLAGLMAGGLSVLLGIIRHCFGADRSVLLGGTLKAVLLGGGFVGFALCLRKLHGSVDDLPLGRSVALLWPPYWGARVLGGGPAAPGFAAALVSTAAILFGLFAWLQRPGGRRGTSRRRPGGPLGRLDLAIARQGPLLGLTAFSSAMLYRSPGFRARVLPIFGLPAAMVALSLAEAEPRHALVLLGMTLQFPAIYMPLLVSFCQLTDEERAGWIFATSPHAAAPALVRQGLLIAITTHVLLPVYSGALLVMLVSGAAAPRAAVTLAAFSLGAAVVVARFALRHQTEPPFTDESDGPVVDTNTLMGLAALMGVVGFAIASLARHWAGLPVALAVLAAAGALLVARPAAVPPTLTRTSRPPPQRAPRARRADATAEANASLRREMLAIVFLYGVLSLLPLLLGAGCSDL